MNRVVNNGMSQMKGNVSSNKSWLDLRYHDSSTSIKKPEELENEMEEPTGSIDGKILDRIQGSMIGMALGDALGAHVEFRPHQYMLENPVTDLEGGGTWGLQKGQFTDDTSMALCLAISLVVKRNYNPYDQLVRYKWWYKNGYMSSTGECFDIGAATSQSLIEFERRQNHFAKEHNLPSDRMDSFSDGQLLKKFNVYCSEPGAAGNGALMRLAPVPLFFYRSPQHAVEYSGRSGQITHGDTKAYDACRYYGALIVAALNGYRKDQLLDKQFYSKHKQWFMEQPLCTEIKLIAEGSYQKPGGYKDGIRGKGYIVNALEAALWAFWSDDNSFEKGALSAVNLGDDTDTTAAIYGQLAGAYYGYKRLPGHWLKHVYAQQFMINLSQWITYEGQMWWERPLKDISPFNPNSSSQPTPHEAITETSVHEANSNIHPLQSEPFVSELNSPKHPEQPPTGKNSYRNNFGPTLLESSQPRPTLFQPSPMDRGTFNYNHRDSLSTYRTPPVGTNPSLILKKVTSNKPRMIQTSTFSSNLPQNYETTSAESLQRGPVLRATQPIDYQEQPITSSRRATTQELSIHDDGNIYSTSKPSSYETNARTSLRKTTSNTSSCKCVPFVPPPTIPESSPPMASKPEKSRSRHRLTGIFHSRKESHSPAAHMQVAYTTANGTNSPRISTNNNISYALVRHTPSAQASGYQNKSPQPAERSQRERPLTGQSKNKSDSLSSHKPPKTRSSHL